MRSKCLWAAALVLSGVAWSPCASAAEAGGFSSTHVHALYGEGFKFQADKQATVTVEHFRTIRGGDVFGFVDLPAQVGSGERPRAYGEAYVRLSGEALAGRKLSFGPVRDVGLSSGVNVGEKTFAAMTGPQVNLAAPGFKVLQAALYAYKADGGAPLTHQASLVWEAPITLSPRVRLKFRGFADWIGSQGAYADEQLITQPQLVLDAGALAGKPGRIFVGTEWKVWKNKYGVSGVDESVAQALVTVRL